MSSAPKQAACAVDGCAPSDHQPDWPCELWPEDSSDYLGEVPALPDVDEEPFQDILLSALTTGTRARARRIDRYLVEQLKLGVRGLEIDYMLDLVMIKVSDSKRVTLDAVEGSAALSRKNMPGKLVLICCDGLVFLEDGRSGRGYTVKEAYVEHAARMINFL